MRQPATEGIHAVNREEMLEFARKFKLEPNGVENDYALVRYDNETG